MSSITKPACCTKDTTSTVVEKCPCGEACACSSGVRAQNCKCMNFNRSVNRDGQCGDNCACGVDCKCSKSISRKCGVDCACVDCQCEINRGCKCSDSCKCGANCKCIDTRAYKKDVGCKCGDKCKCDNYTCEKLQQ